MLFLITEEKIGLGEGGWGKVNLAGCILLTLRSKNMFRTIYMNKTEECINEKEGDGVSTVYLLYATNSQ